MVLWNSRQQGFPGGSVVKNPSANAGDTGSIPGLGRSHMPQSNWALAPQLLSLSSKAQELQVLSSCVPVPLHLGYGSKDGGCMGNWDFFGGKVKTCWWIMCGNVRSWCLLILGLVTGWLTVVFIGKDPRGKQFCEERVESNRFTVATLSFWCY